MAKIFHKSPKSNILRKSVKRELLSCERADGRIDVTKLVVAFGKSRCERRLNRT